VIVLIADKFESYGVAKLKKSGFEVIHEPDLNGDALRDAIARTRCEVLIVRGTEVKGPMLANVATLGLIVRAGAGYNTIDVAAASRVGILVANCPGKNAVAVAELTFGLILALDRRIVENVLDLRSGKWNKKDYSQARGLKGRTLGIIGTGQIGQAVAQRAAAFEMPVVAWSRSLTDELAREIGVQRLVDPVEVAMRCDILSIHLAAASETKKLVNRSVLEALRPGSYVINTARADVIDYEALAKLIPEKNLRVGLDVFANEPPGGSGEFADAIVKAGGVVYGTHHIGASTDQAQDAIAAETVRVVREYAATGRAPNSLNLEASSPASCQMILRHYDKVGVLATVLDKLRRESINVKEMTNTFFQGDAAAVAVIRLGQRPSDALVADIAAMRDMIIQVEVKPV
jgi:D-3-phosphoglycerate dehydrogenase